MSSALATQYLNLLSMSWVRPHFMSFMVGTACLLLERLKMPVICVSFLNIPFGSLAAGVQVPNLDSKDNCPRVTENAHHQGCVPGRGSSYRKIAFLGQQ